MYPDEMPDGLTVCNGCESDRGCRFRRVNHSLLGTSHWKSVSFTGIEKESLMDEIQCSLTEICF